MSRVFRPVPTRIQTPYPVNQLPPLSRIAIIRGSWAVVRCRRSVPSSTPLDFDPAWVSKEQHLVLVVIGLRLDSEFWRSNNRRSPKRRRGNGIPAYEEHELRNGKPFERRGYPSDAHNSAGVSVG